LPTQRRAKAWVFGRLGGCFRSFGQLACALGNAPLFGFAMLVGAASLGGWFHFSKNDDVKILKTTDEKIGN